MSLHDTNRTAAVYALLLGLIGLGLGLGIKTWRRQDNTAICIIPARWRHVHWGIRHRDRPKHQVHATMYSLDSHPSHEIKR